MGMPALRREPRRESRPPRLRVVSPGERAPRSRSTRKPSATRAPHTAGRQLFAVFALCAVAITALGVGRVAMTAAAAQTSMESAKLRKEIKAARYEGDSLEVQQSALAAPSRVRKLAGSKLSLAEPKSVSYWGLAPNKAAKKPAQPKKRVGKGKVATVQPAKAPSTSSFGALVSKVMDVAAGEAQILMVGDVGLASTR